MISLVFFLSFLLELSLSFLSSHIIVAAEPLVISLDTLCRSTMYPKTCYDTLSKSPLINPKQNYELPFFYNQSVYASTGEVSRVSPSFDDDGALSRMIKDTNEHIWQSALEGCRDSLSLALYYLNWCIPKDVNALSSQETRSEFTTWLGASRAHLQSCIDGFEYANNEIRNAVAAIMDNPTKVVTTSLAIVSMIDAEMMSPDDDEPVMDWESVWSSLEEIKDVSPNVVVAKDGSGNYTTITEAINAAPQMSNTRFVIHVTEGVYLENVLVGIDTWNILMYGDGMQKTIISGNLSNNTGYSIDKSFTFGVWGQGFIAMNVGFQNTAPQGSGQAVALKTGSYRSVFYRCLIEGYQDTLYTVSNPQFYRECQIYGSVDFIFGYAPALIQNSDIYVRRPRPLGFGGTATITAQGKGEQYSPSGISIQNCTINAADNLDNITTYLGRPWQSYSTVVVMESYLGSLIDPSGWLAWEGQPVPSTIDYVEYNNWGPGAVTTQRVNWTGLTLNNSQFEASQFTVNSFLDGATWLPATGVPFNGGL